VKVNLSQREIEYLLFLINKSADVSPDKADLACEYSHEDIELMDKLESALQLIEVKRFGLAQAMIRHKALN